ncbi:MAG TPA: alpha/beta hydrolase [Steroidobacteraceae bacterium]|nr:alpha/beta hydrolase [Steroidobacteraceae bacterium]
MQTIAHGAPGASTLRVVLMPGAYHTPNQFLDAGFAEAVRRRSLRVELVLVVPELAHLTDRSWLTALHDEVIAPARAQGAPVWLGGVSLGGFMALRFAAQYPGALDGLCLLAPYLGSRIIAAQIAAQADAAAWQMHSLAEDDDERRIWHYIATLADSMNPTRIFFGYGASDRFADTQRVLAQAVPATHATVRIIAGGHDWTVWRSLWDEFLDRYGGSA